MAKARVAEKFVIRLSNAAKARNVAPVLKNVSARIAHVQKTEPTAKVSADAMMHVHATHVMASVPASAKTASAKTATVSVRNCKILASASVLF